VGVPGGIDTAPPKGREGETKTMTAKQPQAEAIANSTRRAYQQPRILFREPLEAMASICSPAPPAKADRGHCPTGPISS
jgi:hypothetical protein